MSRWLPVWIALVAIVLNTTISARRSSDIRILVRHQSTVGAGLAAGLGFGADEAAYTMRLLGRSVTLTERATADTASGIVTTNGAAAWVSAGPDAACTFAVSVTPERAASALELWRKTNQSQAAHTPRVAEWHPSLRRYGAAQLNERFVRATGAPMSAEAWVGWVAVKSLVEAASRARPGEASCDALVRLSLDGHKGQPLKFEANTRELRQPLYVVAGDDVLDEIDVS